MNIIISRASKLIEKLRNKDFYNSKNFLFLFYFLLLLAWTIRNFILVNTAELVTLQSVITSQILKAVIWIIPVFFVLKYITKEGFWKYTGLDSWNIKSVKITVLISILWCFINLLPNIIISGGVLNTNWTITWNSLVGAVIGASFIEEIMFRGFLLQKAQAIWGFWIANVITSLSFVIIHWPRWFFFNEFELYSNFYLFIFSLLCGVIVKYGKNKIYGSIFFHALNNYLASI